RALAPERIHVDTANTDLPTPGGATTSASCPRRSFTISSRLFHPVEIGSPAWPLTFLVCVSEITCFLPSFLESACHRPRLVRSLVIVRPDRVSETFGFVSENPPDESGLCTAPGRVRA